MPLHFIVIADSTVTTTSRAVTGLTNLTQYFWRVYAKNVGELVLHQQYSIHNNYSCSCGSALTAPANNATNVAINTTLTWGAVPTAATYRVQVATDTLFTGATLIVDDATVTTNSRIVTLSNGTLIIGELMQLTLVEQVLIQQDLLSLQ